MIKTSYLSCSLMLKCQHASNCWHFNIYEQDEVYPQGVEHEKHYLTFGPGYHLSLSLITVSSMVNLLSCKTRIYHNFQSSKFVVIAQKYEQIGFTTESCHQTMQREMETVRLGLHCLPNCPITKENRRNHFAGFVMLQLTYILSQTYEPHRENKNMSLGFSTRHGSN